MVHLLFVFLLFIHLHKGLRIIFYFNEISIQRKRTKKWPNDRDGLITNDHEKRKDSSVTSGQSFSKWANRGLSLFIFVLFKHKHYIKTVDVSGIGTWIVAVEGEHADHLTTTMPPPVVNLLNTLSS